MKYSLRFILFIVLLLAACTKTSTMVGNGEAYNGGSELEKTLAATRSRLILAVDKTQALFPQEIMCQSVLCSTDQSDKHCDLLRALSPAQRSQCAQFLVENLSEIKSIHVSAPPRLLASARPLVVRENGEERVVDAVTPLGRGGDIIFNYERVNAMHADDLLALLFHETGHKLSVRITDEGPVGTFASGRELLDIAASAFVVMASLKDSLGFFQVESRRFYANAVGQYCEFVDMTQWQKAGGPTLESATIRLSRVPPALASSGTCALRGFFSSQSVGYYANNFGHYCSFGSWTEWVAAGGSSREDEIVSYETIPARMTFDGRCNP